MQVRPRPGPDHILFGGGNSVPVASRLRGPPQAVAGSSGEEHPPLSESLDRYNPSPRRMALVIETFRI